MIFFNKAQIKKFLSSNWPFYLLLGVFIILRIPSLFEPHWYGDEGIYASVANAIEHGKKLYIDVFDNRLPGIYYLYALASSANRLIMVRIFNLIAGVITMIGIYALAKRMNLKIMSFLPLLVATWFLGTPRIEANIANTENFFLPLTIWAVYLAVTNTYKGVVFSGILFGLAFLIKFPPVFTACAVGLYLLVMSKVDLKERMKKIGLFCLGFALPVLIVFLLLQINGNAKEAIQFGLLNNSSYVAEYSQKGITLYTKLLFLVILVSLTIVLYYKKITSQMLTLVLLLLFFDYFAALFSGRRFEHYLLQTVPSMSLLTGFLGLSLLRKGQYFIKLACIGLFVVGILVGSNIFYMGNGIAVKMKVDKYYEEFLSSVFTGKSQNALPFTFFREDQRLTLAKKLVDSHPNKKIFFYTDESWVYDYTHTVPITFYVASYHQFLVPNGAQKMISQLKSAKPDIIVVDKHATITEQLRSFLNSTYTLSSQDEVYMYYKK